MAAFQWGRIWGLDGPSKAYPSAHELNVTTSSDGDCVSAGYEHTALLADGEVYTSGSGADGQLGRPGSGKDFLPIPGLRECTPLSVTCGAYSTHVVSSEGRVLECGALWEPHEAVLPGEEEQGQGLPGLAERMNRNEYLRRIILRSEAAYLAATDVNNVSMSSAAHVRAEDGQEAEAEGTGQGEGNTRTGQPAVDISVLKMRVRRIRVPNLRPARGLDSVFIVGLAAGYAHCLCWDRQGRLYAVGYNDRGQLGTGNRIAAAEYGPVVMPAGAAIVHAACGQQHSVAVSRSGLVWAWGSNALGQLGTGDSTDRLRPEPVRCTGEDESGAVETHGDVRSGTVVIDAACGAVHTVLLTAHGRVLFFGHSEYGQAGPTYAGRDLVHTSRYFYVPRLVEGLLDSQGETALVRRVAAGAQFTVALLKDGSLLAWGWGAHYCLGHGLDLRGSSGDVGRVQGLQGRCVRALACGYHHAACLTWPDTPPAASHWAALFRAANGGAGQASGALESAGEIQTGKGNDGRGSLGVVRSIERAAGQGVFAQEWMDGGGGLPDWRTRRSAASSSEQSSSLASQGSSEDATEGGHEVTLALAPCDVQLCAGIHAQAQGALTSASTATAAGGAGVKALWTELGQAADRMLSRRQGVPGRPGLAPAVSAPTSRPAPAVKATSSAAAAAVRTPTSNAAGSPFVPGESDVVFVHSFLLAARCAVLASALEASSRQGVLRPLSLDLNGVQGVVEHIPPGAAESRCRWRITFPTLGRPALYALASYLYSDRLGSTEVAPHVLTSLLKIASPQGLQLPRVHRLVTQRLKIATSPGRSAIPTEGEGGGQVEPSPSVVGPVLRLGAKGALGQGRRDTGTSSQMIQDSTFTADLLSCLTSAAALADGASSVAKIVAADVYLAVDDGRGEEEHSEPALLPCHTIILARYDYFRKVMKGEFREGSGFHARGGTSSGPGQPLPLPRILIKEADVRDVRALLGCIYSGDTRMFEASESEGGLEPDRALSTLALAQRLLLTTISSAGQAAIADRLQAGGGTDKATLQTVLDFSEAHGLGRLAKHAKTLLAGS